MAVATTADVAARIGRPLTSREETQVAAFLEDAEAEIIRLGFKKIADPNWKPLIVKVECAVVRRAARLPDSNQNLVPSEESIGFADQARVQGAVYLRREERRSLGLPLTGAARITPQAPAETRDPRFDWGPGWDEEEGDGYWYDGWPY